MNNRNNDPGLLDLDPIHTQEKGNGHSSREHNEHFPQKRPYSRSEKKVQCISKAYYHDLIP